MNSNKWVMVFFLFFPGFCYGLIDSKSDVKEPAVNNEAAVSEESFAEREPLSEEEEGLPELASFESEGLFAKQEELFFFVEGNVGEDAIKGFNLKFNERNNKPVLRYYFHKSDTSELSFHFFNPKIRFKKSLPPSNHNPFCLFGKCLEKRSKICFFKDCSIETCVNNQFDHCQKKWVQCGERGNISEQECHDESLQCTRSVKEHCENLKDKKGFKAN